MQSVKEIIKNKRVLAFDYGLKRTGVAVCDEFHITVTPKYLLESDEPDFFEKISRIITDERAGAIVVGVPNRLDDKMTEVIEKILLFIENLKKITELNIFEFDESYSTIRASKIMLEIGKKKKDRAKKGNKDLVAAAVILRDFLQENDG